MTADGIRLSEARLCRLADVARGTRQSWATQGLLNTRSGETYTQLDLLATVAFKALLAALGPTDARDAWRQISAEYEQHVLTDRLDVVFDESDHEARMATTDSQLAESVRHGRPVRIIALGEELQRARAAFDRYRAGRVADVSAAERGKGRGATRGR